MGSAYDRERVLKHRPNAFLHERLGLPASDDYSRLNEQALSELKSVLSDINNIFTLKGCLVFGGVAEYSAFIRRVRSRES